MRDVAGVFGAMMAVMIPVALAGALFMRIAFAKRSRHRAAPTAELEQLSARLAQLEGREDRVLELEERLDFVERMLGGIREGRMPDLLPPKRKATTPV